jgi:hypothetical protein
MAEYLVLSDVYIDSTSCDKSWMYIGIAMKLAHSVSLVLPWNLRIPLTYKPDRSS